MRYSFLFPFAMLAFLIFCAVTFAQPPQISCPPGQGPMHAIGPDGKLVSWCYPGGGGGLAHDAPVRGTIESCVQDTDCPAGISRCVNGICGRTNTMCDVDADCKYSEVCDTARKRCADKGGQY